MALAAAVDEASATDVDATPERMYLKELEVGRTLNGTIAWFKEPGSYFVDIGAKKKGILEVGETQDGFPPSGRKKRNETVQVRVLEVAGEKVYLTMRSGSLARPPRVTREPKNIAAFESIPSDVWLEGEVRSLTRWGAYVAVASPSGEALGVGLVRPPDFDDGFSSDAARAVRGGRVRVRLLRVVGEKVDLSMREP